MTIPPLLPRLALGLVPILLYPALGCDRIRGADTPTTPEVSPDFVVTDPVIGVDGCPVPFPFVPHQADRAAYQAALPFDSVDEPPELRWMPANGVSGEFFVELQVVFLFNGRARVTSVLHRSDDCIAAVMVRRVHYAFFHPARLHGNPVSVRGRIEFKHPETEDEE